MFGPDFLNQHAQHLKTENAQGEFYITDLIQVAAVQNRVSSIDMCSQEMMGINSQLQRASAESILLRQLRDTLMEAGVRMDMPETIWIGANTTIEPGVHLEPHVKISGRTAIRQRARIAHGSVICDSLIDDYVTIHPYSHIDKARIESHTNIGPFARLREGSHIESKCKIGNFVETKKTRLRAGAKASHLSYLGDADIGSGSNVGAGTITCNYDGFGKHPTVLGNNVFIGSNSTLVAPLQLGDNAYVAAGSAVTDTVPAGALAIGRQRQVNKADYVQGLREKLNERKK